MLYLLASGTRRYSEVLYEVGEISKKTLTQTLRALERDGLVTRRVLPEIAVRVEYSLTPLGWSITGPLMAMYEWAARSSRTTPSRVTGSRPERTGARVSTAGVASRRVRAHGQDADPRRAVDPAEAEQQRGGVVAEAALPQGAIGVHPMHEDVATGPQPV